MKLTFKFNDYCNLIHYEYAIIPYELFEYLPEYELCVLFFVEIRLDVVVPHRVNIVMELLAID